MKEPTKIDIFEVSLRALGIDVGCVENAGEIYEIVRQLEKGWEPTLRDMCEVEVRMEENYKKYCQQKKDEKKVQSNS